MSDATLKDYSALVGCVIVGTHPILPKPSWGQDAAYLAFVIDGMNAEIDRLRAALEHVDRLLTKVMDESNQHIFEPVAVIVTAALAEGADR